jgi:hypothetical protein
MRALFAAAVLAAVAARSSPSAAEEPADPGVTRPRLGESLATSRRLVSSVPALAALEGSWSIVLELDTLLTSRRWDAPYPEGLLAQAATRILYGSSWTAMLGLEGALAALASGGDLAWIGEARYVSATSAWDSVRAASSGSRSRAPFGSRVASCSRRSSPARATRARAPSFHPSRRLRTACRGGARFRRG